MAANVKPIYPGVVNFGAVLFENADGTDLQVVFTAGANGSRIDSLIATSDDGTNRLLTLYVNNGVDDIPIGSTTVNANAGTDGTEPTKNLFDLTLLPQFDFPSGNDPALFLEAEHTLKAGLDGAVTADKALWVVATGGDF